MFANERREKIRTIINKNGAVTTSSLVKQFGVSIETIRKDLLVMEQSGMLSRVHGGAVVKNAMNPFLDLKRRNQVSVKQKNQLSEKASEFVREGDIIAVDSGSTAISFSEILKERFTKLTVITNSHDVLDILCGHKEFEIIICGGYYMPEENAFYGALTLDTIKNLYIQKAFIFPSAISIEHGICDYQKDLYQVQRQFIKSSEDIYILADSSKFEKKALLKIADINDDYYYITDELLSDELIELYKENNLNVFTPKKRVIP